MLGQPLTKGRLPESALTDSSRLRFKAQALNRAEVIDPMTRARSPVILRARRSSGPLSPREDSASHAWMRDTTSATVTW